MRKLVGLLGLLLFVGVGAVGGVEVWRLAGATYDKLTSPAHIAAGLQPQLKAADAERITIGYLNAQTGSLAAPGLHIAPFISGMWALTADQAAALDGCIPAGKGSGIVWVTKGRGDYLNLADHPWSSTTPAPDDPKGACTDPAEAGTIVIDDATGQILGVYPDNGPAAPHPSPKATAPSD